MNYIRATIACPKFISKQKTPNHIIEVTPWFESVEQLNNYKANPNLTLIYCVGCQKVCESSTFKTIMDKPKTLAQINNEIHNPGILKK